MLNLKKIIAIDVKATLKHEKDFKARKEKENAKKKSRKPGLYNFRLFTFIFPLDIPVLLSSTIFWIMKIEIPIRLPVCS